MFRKIYKEANDEIYINESLIDDIFTKANTTVVPKQKRINYRYIYSAAAAIMIVIGGSTAITRLTYKPAPETTTKIIPAAVEETETVLNDTEMNSVISEDSVNAVIPENEMTGNESTVKEKIEKKTSRNTATKKANTAENSEKTTDKTADDKYENTPVTESVQNTEENIPVASSVQSAEENIPVASSVQNAEENIPAAVSAQDGEIISASDSNSAESQTDMQPKFMQRDISESDFDAVEKHFYISEGYSEEQKTSGGGGSSAAPTAESFDLQESLEDSMNLPSDFSLTEESDGYCKYSGDNGKSFEIYENQTPQEEPVMSFTDNGNEYSVTSENMSTSEIKNIFENLE